MSSFQAQYGIRLSREVYDMSWEEFKQLLSGVGPETPLGRIVSIRMEDDKEILKRFSKDQHRIRNEWRQRRARNVSEADMQRILEGFKQAFISIAGGGKN